MVFDFLTLIKFDKIWCGHHQVPASLLLQVSGETKSCAKLASFRFFLCLSLLTELMGYFMITLGLSSSKPVWIFFCGVALKMSGELLGAFFQNRSGIFLSLELQKYLKSLITHALEIRSFLVDKGCTETEIHSLASLPKEVYQSELNSYQRARILNVGAPISCGLALVINGDVMTSLVVMTLGLLSFPIGEKFFKENTFRRESELRIGLATQLIPYVEKVYKEHIWLTTKVNFLSQLPLLLFLFRFIWNGAGQILASFFALTQGLVGLTGSLAFQKARVSSIKTTETTSHLIGALSSPYLIVTPQRWKDHCCQSLPQKPPTLQGDESGVILENFSAKLPLKENETFSLSFFIPFGSIALLRAPSGKGKTTFLAALTHLIEHTGDIFFVSQGHLRNVHDLTREEFESKIFFFREENVEKSARLVDLFKHSTLIDSAALIEQSKQLFDPMLVDLAWKAYDNLLEQEINNLESQKQSIFPDIMLDFLKKIRENKIAQIKIILKEMGGNLATNRIYPERNFHTLSSGEKRRLATLMAFESCRVNPFNRFIILDEPLAHIDKQNIILQIQTILKMQKLYNPSILIISHHCVEEMKEQLQNVFELNF